MTKLDWRPCDHEGRIYEVAFDVRDGYVKVIDGYTSRRNDYWFYIVRHERAALVLSINTPYLCGAAQPYYWEKEDRGFDGFDLSMHQEFPTNPEAIKDGWEGEECCYTVSGRCYGYSRSTSLGASELFHSIISTEGFALDTFQLQSPIIWPKLIEWFDSWYASAMEEVRAIAHLKQCPQCGGKGIVER